MVYGMIFGSDLYKPSMSKLCSGTSWTMSSLAVQVSALTVYLEHLYWTPHQMMDSTDEKDIELMFAEARRYDLLTAEQEQTIDAQKWRAVRNIHGLIAEHNVLEYLAQLADQCINNPPLIARFPNRELHFVLRRELAALFADGGHAAEAKLQLKSWERSKPRLQEEHALMLLNCQRV